MKKQCIQCGKEYSTYRVKQKLCSFSCSTTYKWKTGVYKNMPEKVRKNYDDSYVVDDKGCWIWDHSIDTDGYGLIWRNNKNIRAFKYFYKKFKGETPKGLVLDHLCRNGKCVNPDHLEPVTTAENIRRGKVAKLKKEDISTIKDLYKKGIKQKEIGKRFNVGQDHISRIVTELRWVAI